MLQNRVVGGATMGTDRLSMGTDRRTGSQPAMFGPYGYLNLVAAVVVTVAAVLALESDWIADSAVGRPLVLLALPLCLRGLIFLTGGRGADTDRRYRNGPRNLAYWAQWSSSGVIALILVVAVVAPLIGWPVVAIVALAAGAGVVAGLAPIFFQALPSAPAAPAAFDEASSLDSTR